MRHEITRVKHELRRRTLTVLRAEQLTPHMRRVTLGGDTLDGFNSPAPDDHVKIFVPSEAGMVGRDYTPRRYDTAAGELMIDFALHDAGPATAWARAATVGQTLEIGGPRGSSLIPHDFDWWLLIGDETALPAIARRVEELPAGTLVTTVVAVPGFEDEQQIATAAHHRPVWVHRTLAAAHEAAPLLDALTTETLPTGDGFIWIAAESGVARALRQHVLASRMHPPAWTKVSGYWTTGKADTTEKFDRQVNVPR